MAEGGTLLALGIFLIALPFLLLALIGILWSVAYPLMLIWAVLFSGKKLDRQIASTTSREASLRESLGRDPLTTIDGGYRTDITSCGIVWTGVVFGPSHWHLLIGWFNNLTGGSIDIFQKVVSAGRAEAMQRLRERADSQWMGRCNQRQDRHLRYGPSRWTGGHQGSRSVRLRHWGQVRLGLVINRRLV